MIFDSAERRSATELEKITKVDFIVNTFPVCFPRDYTDKRFMKEKVVENEILIINKHREKLTKCDSQQIWKRGSFSGTTLSWELETEILNFTLVSLILENVD